MLPAFNRVLAAYEQGLKKLADELVAETNPPEHERAQLMLVTRVLQAVVKTYEAEQLDQAVTQEGLKSVMFAAGSERRILNVSLRRLVDDALMTPWYARFLNSSLGMKRTIIISGAPNTGKSTLLNALIDLLPRDHRIVSIDDSDESLPVLQDRSFTVQLKAKRGTPARTAVFRKAADMKPTWVVAGELVRRDGPGFLEALTGSQSGGLTTVQTVDPETTLNDWLAMSKPVAEQLKVLNPLVVHLRHDAEGRPHVERVVEVTTDRGCLMITPREQVDTEQVGVTGGQRSELALAEQRRELAWKS
jgi:type IV secretory pathway ATPase VirB11/archaellum biosynthesis ATPase